MQPKRGGQGAGVALDQTILRDGGAGDQAADDGIAVTDEDAVVTGGQADDSREGQVPVGIGERRRGCIGEADAAAKGIIGADVDKGRAGAVGEVRATTGEGEVLRERRATCVRENRHAAVEAGAIEAIDRKKGAAAELGTAGDDERALIDLRGAGVAVRVIREDEDAVARLDEAVRARKDRVDRTARADADDIDIRGRNASRGRESQRAAGDIVAGRGKGEAACSDGTAERYRAACSAAKEGDIERGVVPRHISRAIVPVSRREIIPRAGTTAGCRATEERIPKTIGRLCFRRRAEHEGGRGEHRDRACERGGLAGFRGCCGCDFLFPLGGEVEEEAGSFHVCSNFQRVEMEREDIRGGNGG